MRRATAQRIISWQSRSAGLSKADLIVNEFMCIKGKMNNVFKSQLISQARALPRLKALRMKVSGVPRKENVLFSKSLIENKCSHENNFEKEVEIGLL